MSDAIEVISISSGSVASVVPVEHVLCSSSPSLFTKHLIHMNDLSDLLCARPHTKCTQTKKNRDSTKTYKYQKCCCGCSYRINWHMRMTLLCSRKLWFLLIMILQVTCNILHQSTWLMKCISKLITWHSIICLSQTMVQRRYVTDVSVLVIFIHNSFFVMVSVPFVYFSLT
jgi:hypothetical protein